MSLVPNNTNPLQDYVDGKFAPSFSVNGLVIDQIYGATGILDAINITTQNVYQDPTTNQQNTPGQITLPGANVIPTYWTSPIVDDIEVPGWTLTFNFNTTTYLNYVIFEVQQVPLTWTLSRVSVNGSIIQLYSGIIPANTSLWQTVEVQLSQTYEFDSNNTLVLSLQKIVNGQQYSFNIANFLAKLIVQTVADITVSGSEFSSLTVQNRLGFVETYMPFTDSLSNIATSSLDQFWKSSPQPVGDAVVYLTINLGSTQTINEMYLDPLYSGNRFNLYYSSDSINWTPTLVDLTLKKGVYELPFINAQYLKLEFTQLTAEVYDLPLDSIQKTVDVFPDYVDAYFTALEQAIPDNTSTSYYTLNGSNSTNTNVNYVTQPSIATTLGLVASQLAGNTYGAPVGNRGTGSASYGASPGTYTIVDPTISYKTIQDVANLGSVYNNSTNEVFLTRRFYTYGPHNYKQVTINQTWHESYFTGLKYASFYCIDPTVQNDYSEFIDCFLPVISGGQTLPSPCTIINSSTSNYTLQSGGGYIGLSNQVLQTENLETISEYQSFKIAALNTDWQNFLTPNQTLLIGTPQSLDVTISGASVVSQTVGVPASYGIYTLSSSTGVSSITSPYGGFSQNLFTLAEATITSGTGWTNGPTISGSIHLISGVNIPDLSTQDWAEVYGGPPYGTNAYGRTAAATQIQNPYTFLVTCSGFTGNVAVTIMYSGSTLASGAFSDTFSSTFAVVTTGTQISYTTIQPLNTDYIMVTLSGSGVVSYTDAGLFNAPSGVLYSNPIVLNNMRLSGVARVYLPNTNFGVYTCSLYSSANTAPLATRQINSIPLRTWVDIEVPFTSTGSNNQNLYVQLLQTNGYQNGISEVYEVALLGVFYNPVAYQFSIDQGTHWYNITAGINNPESVINLPELSSQLMIQAIALEDDTAISAIDIVPMYTQNPYYNNTIISFLSDPKVNQTSARTPPILKPLFQLSSALHPLAYDIQQLMNILAPFSLD